MISDLRTTLLAMQLLVQEPTDYVAKVEQPEV